MELQAPPREHLLPELGLQREDQEVHQPAVEQHGPDEPDAGEGVADADQRLEHAGSLRVALVGSRHPAATSGLPRGAQHPHRADQAGGHQRSPAQPPRPAGDGRAHPGSKVQHPDRGSGTRGQPDRGHQHRRDAPQPVVDPVLVPGPAEEREDLDLVGRQPWRDPARGRAAGPQPNIPCHIDSPSSPMSAATLPASSTTRAALWPTPTRMPSTAPWSRMSSLQCSWNA